MCGLAGFLSWSRFPALAAEIATCMADAIAHRGPDDAGVWTDATAGVALAHRRLAILDLTLAGHQPMQSACGRYVLIFNGEIYNHLELRHALSLAAMLPVGGWRGHADTETLLQAFVAWGVEATLRRCVGMFALALWDRDTRSLTLARDRLGEKPLYYGWQGQVFLFGSELKALQANPVFRSEIDRDALALYLRHNCVPAPYSIWRGIRKLMPGMLLTLRHGEVDPQQELYWSVHEAAERGTREPFAGTDEAARENLEFLLRRSVAGQMLADVPLGAFLSGGVDSSLVLALMRAQSGQPVRSFTIGFQESNYNEAEHARAVAAHLGTEHTDWVVTPDQCMALIPRLPTLYDEPFADSSQIPTFLVSELARQHVTVSLSGDGGDELFGGYNRYVWAPVVWRRIGWAPRPLRAALAGVLMTFPPAAWNILFDRLGRFLPAGWRYANPGDKLHKLAEILAVRSPEEIYLGLISHWKNASELVLEADRPASESGESARAPHLTDFESHMMYLDQITYLPDDILTKVDRAAMGVSLETRVPFLDHRVVEFAWSLPLSMKIRDGQGKWLLRQVLYRHIPQTLIERPKMGFGIPLDVWLRGPLREWAASLLDDKRLRSEGIFDPVPIRRKWLEHLSGRRNWSHHLWDVLMFQAWLETRS